MKQDYKKGYLETEGRRFLLEFWESTDWSLPYARVSEVRMKRVRKHWFSRETVLRESPEQIAVCNTDGSRMEWCKEQIREYLRREKERQIDERQIEELCAKGERGAETLCERKGGR